MSYKALKRYLLSVLTFALLLSLLILSSCSNTGNTSDTTTDDGNIVTSTDTDDSTTTIDPELLGTKAKRAGELNVRFVDGIVKTKVAEERDALQIDLFDD